MKLNRYIKTPLLFAILYAISYGLIQDNYFWGVIQGFFIGLGLQLYSDYKVRQIKPDAIGNDFNRHQKQYSVLFYNYDETFQLCLESISKLENPKIISQDYLTGVIEFKTGNWLDGKNKVNLKLTRISDNTTEVEVITNNQTKFFEVDSDNGISLKNIQTLKEFFHSQNGKVNLKILEEKSEMPINNVYRSKIENYN